MTARGVPGHIVYLPLGITWVAATLESVFGFCVGCAIFAGLIRAGWIPDAVCAECNDIWSRTSRA
jgi:Domain of unknown function (DUF4395)